MTYLEGRCLALFTFVFLTFTHACHRGTLITTLYYNNKGTIYCPILKKYRYSNTHKKIKESVAQIKTIKFYLAISLVNMKTFSNTVFSEMGKTKTLKLCWMV